MSTPATFEPATLPPPSTPNDQDQSSGLGIDPMAHTKHKQDKSRWDEEQEEKREQALKEAKLELEHPKLPNYIETQKSISVFDSSLSRANAPQPHY